jgi:hypothetical protein
LGSGRVHFQVVLAKNKIPNLCELQLETNLIFGPEGFTGF